MSFTMPNTIANSTSRDARPIQANFAAITAALQGDYIRADGTVAMSGPLEVLTPTLPTHASTMAYVDAAIPPGVILDYGGDVAPSSLWSLGVGQLVNKSEFPILWGLFQNKFGTSTATQFYLPDLRSVFIVGKGAATWSDVIGETGGSKDAIIPSHVHPMPHTHDTNVRYGWAVQAFSSGTSRNTAIGTAQSPASNADEIESAGTNTANTSTATGGVAVTDKNLPPYIVMNKIIRMG